MTPSPRPVNRLSVAFPARVNEIASVFSVIDVLARWQSVPEAIVYGVHLVVDELIANVVEHADAPDGAQVCFSLELARDTLSIRFAWPGVRFDPTAVAGTFTASRIPDDPLTGLGMGLVLVKAFAHEVKYRWEAERNVVEVIRVFGKNPETFLGTVPDGS